MSRRRSSSRAAVTPADALRLTRSVVTSGEMLTAAAATISLRTSALGLAALGLVPHDARESQRMVAEKAEAAVDAATAAAAALPAAQSHVAGAMAAHWIEWGRWAAMPFAAAPPVAATAGLSTAAWTAWLSAYDAALRPYHKRTTANARRLSRKGGKKA
ncbi:hypothetical protein C882_2733 [Caenispirillum salinarum AK4]|uniref:Phasin domain-containing protein n=1 Tax=Caenispirillum salinarum AK4 TaxID=1238182 RepID=K9H6K0_9PROT|nr:hypothetical protein [Caenispirillum salinarum]EKV32654.1 hypothetical protein C882_2733 [Caenispirillum salinarum AK4]